MMTHGCDTRHRPTTYICLLSEHNVAELESVLTIRPSHLFVVATSFFSTERYQRFCMAACENLPGLQITRVAEEIDGQDWQVAEQYCHETLRPLVQQQQQQGHCCLLNYTGGNKILSHSCVSTLADICDEIHYRAFDKKENVPVLQRRGRNGIFVLPRALQGLTPLQQARLYTAIPEPRDLPDWPEQRSLVWESYQDPEGAYWWWSEHILTPSTNRSLDKKFCKKWQLQGDPNKEAWSVQCADIEPEHIDWLLSVCTDHARISSDDERLYLPAWSSPFGRWLKGFWYEAQVYDWLRACGIDAVNICRNVIIKRSQEDTGNEGDIIFSHKGRLRMLEVKCGLQDHLTTRDADKLRHAADALGKVSCAYLLSEHAGDLTSSRFVDFTRRCDALGIAVLRSQDDLGRWLHPDAKKAVRSDCQLQ